MKPTRRGFFGLIAGFLMAPFAKPRKPTLNEMNQYLWSKHWDNMAVATYKRKIAMQFSDDLERAFLGVL